MTKHRGEHPRMGATDVCPFVPVSGVTMEECAAIAHALGERVGLSSEFPAISTNLPPRLAERKNLAHCRKGQYEGLAKLETAEGAPDFGPAAWNEQTQKSGATAIGARDFLIAYNINLNTTSSAAPMPSPSTSGIGTRKAHGRTGSPIVKDANGEPERIPGSLKA